MNHTITCYNVGVSHCGFIDHDSIRIDGSYIEFATLERFYQLTKLKVLGNKHGSTHDNVKLQKASQNFRNATNVVPIGNRGKTLIDGGKESEWTGATAATTSNERELATSSCMVCVVRKEQESKHSIL